MALIIQPFLHIPARHATTARHFGVCRGVWLYDILIPMAKQKKKRNKPYTGSDARKARPRAIKVNAVVRSRPAQWWHDNKRRTKLTIGGALVAAVIVWLVIEFIHLLHP